MKKKDKTPTIDQVLKTAWHWKHLIEGRYYEDCAMCYELKTRKDQ